MMSARQVSRREGWLGPGAGLALGWVVVAQLVIAQAVGALLVIAQAVGALLVLRTASVRLLFAGDRSVPFGIFKPVLRWNGPGVGGGRFFGLRRTVRRPPCRSLRCPYG